MFPVVIVDSRRKDVLEQLGTKRKFWFNDDQGRRMLFKAEERGTGEDWAEKLACELCKRLGLPHVEYQLAEEAQTRIPGVVCETFVPAPLSLELGNQILLARDPSYPAKEGRKYRVREHTVAAVAEVVGAWGMPPDTYTNALPEGVSTALDVFIGYVMLDAWIANQDRHHENWGAIREGKLLRLAPTYDHGASLARNLSDEERKERMTTRDMNRQLPSFVRKARSAFYGEPSDAKPLPTVDAWRAFAIRSRVAATAWLERLRVIEVNDIKEMLAEVPPARMSRVGREFTLRLLSENQKRMLEGRLDE